MTYKFEDYTNIFVLGNIQPIPLEKLKEILSKKEDCLFIYTGDFKSVQNYDEYINIFEKIEHTLDEHNNFFLLIRGNIDDPKHFKAKSQAKKDLSEFAYHSILVPDYSVLLTANHSILCIGGARSLNNPYQISNANNKSEMSSKPRSGSISSLENIDIVISHDAPINVFPIDMTEDFKHFKCPVIESYALYDKNVKTDIYKNRHILKEVYNVLSKSCKIDKWIYGHYNKSNTTNLNNTDFISLNIKEIIKI